MKEPLNFNQFLDAAAAAIALRVAKLLPMELPQQPNQTKPVDENPIPTKEVLQILGISEPTLRKRRLEGKVPYIKQGRHIYYFRSAILESLKQSQQQEEVRSRRGYGRNGTTYGR